MTSRRAFVVGRSVRREGVGLHGGRPVAVVLEPAPRGHGRVFWRDGVAIAAHVDNVVGAARATTLGRDGVCVGMVEHLLAAFVLAGVEDVLVRVEGDELPLLDGSAGAWTDALAEAGLVDVGAARAVTPPAQVRVERGASWAEVTPIPARERLRAPRLHVTVDFDGADVGAVEWQGDALVEVLGARTFGFAGELDALRAAGLAGGVMDAVEEGAIVVLGAGAPALARPRTADEPVRHKVLDLVGDLALLGARLHADVRVHRGGHALHHDLVRALTVACVPLDIRAFGGEDGVSLQEAP